MASLTHDTKLNCLTNATDGLATTASLVLLGIRYPDSPPEICYGIDFVDTEQVAKLLSDHTKELATHWDAQLTTLTNALKLSNRTPSFPASNSVPLPKFSGDGSEDVNEFLANFERTARFYKLNEDRKAETFPLSLTGNANVWFNTTPGLSGKNFEYLATVLKTQFHSDSDVWLLRQKLNERKQLPSETVSEFAAAIRRLAQRINLPHSESINHFIQGLRPDLKNFFRLNPG